MSEMGLKTGYLGIIQRIPLRNIGVRSRGGEGAAGFVVSPRISLENENAKPAPFEHHGGEVRRD